MTGLPTLTASLCAHNLSVSMRSPFAALLVLTLTLVGCQRSEAPATGPKIATTTSYLEAAVRILEPWIRQIHVKDARRTKVPGTWGEEVPVGTGEVNWTAFFEALQQADFRGDGCIEREAGEQRVVDIRSARQYISTLF